MGVEYRHFLVVDDVQWRPESDTVQRIEALLRDWSLIRGAANIVDLAPGPRTKSGTLISPTSPGAGLAVVYDGAVGAAVENVAGPSLYPGMASADRYLMSATLVLGDDYRVQWSSDDIYFELLSPPLANGTPVIGDDEDPYDILFSTSFPTENVTTPPVVIARVADHAKAHVAWDSCLGFWRACLVLDFGKDLPRFTELTHALPADEFVTGLSSAFRGRLVEIGEFY